jgi:hypothetical protein
MYSLWTGGKKGLKYSLAPRLRDINHMLTAKGFAPQEMGILKMKEPHQLATKQYKKIVKIVKIAELTISQDSQTPPEILNAQSKRFKKNVLAIFMLKRRLIGPQQPVEICQLRFSSFRSNIRRKT